MDDALKKLEQIGVRKKEKRKKKRSADPEPKIVIAKEQPSARPDHLQRQRRSPVRDSSGWPGVVAPRKLTYEDNSPPPALARVSRTGRGNEYTDRADGPIILIPGQDNGPIPRVDEYDSLTVCEAYSDKRELRSF